VFSLGSTLVFAATGRPPFGSQPMGAVMYRIANQPPDLTGVPEEGQLRRVVTACLAKTQAARPPLAHVIAGLSEPGPGDEGATPRIGRPSPGRPPVSPPSSRRPGTSTQTARLEGWPPSDEAAEPDRRKTSKLWAAAAAVIVLAVAVPLIHGVLAAAPTVPVGLAGVYSASQYGFNLPAEIAVDSNHVWVTNSQGNSVTELDAGTGAWIQTLAGGHYGFNYPQEMAFDGAHVWVTNFGGDTQGNSVTEINASNGAWVRTLSGAGYGFNKPAGIAVDGTHIWVTSPHGNSVTEIDAGTGTLIRTLSGDGYRFDEPSGIAVDGTNIWITNISGNSMEELNAGDGSLERTVSGPSFHFDSPNPVVIAGDHAWIGSWYSPGGLGSVTELTLG